MFIIIYWLYRQAKCDVLPETYPNRFGDIHSPAYSLLTHLHTWFVPVGILEAWSRGYISTIKNKEDIKSMIRCEVERIFIAAQFFKDDYGRTKRSLITIPDGWMPTEMLRVLPRTRRHYSQPSPRCTDKRAYFPNCSCVSCLRLLFHLDVYLSNAQIATKKETQR